MSVCNIWWFAAWAGIARQKTHCTEQPSQSLGKIVEISVKNSMKMIQQDIKIHMQSQLMWTSHILQFYLVQFQKQKAHCTQK